MKKRIPNDLKASLLEDAPVIMAFHDLENNIVWANKAYEKATGLSLRQMEGTKCHAAWDFQSPAITVPSERPLKREHRQKPS